MYNRFLPTSLYLGFVGAYIIRLLTGEQSHSIF